MLARSFRLKKREIDRVYKKSNRFFEDFLLVRTLPNTAKHSRFAVIIPKAVVAKSVNRSRLKRKTTEAITENLMLLKTNYDFIFSFKKLPDEAMIDSTVKKIFQNVK
ncbi:TPA: ribonuclease P protein component [Candidatus Berkelbacteria bacterium]|uniref:Ribonuclease P protein component n=1 Tax=Berkelbacteria bacterium GW2011_GWE1_39_12 TaxID=1618337 RepID=A0A0G4B337_9BACT|nr:MAG: hypothetical protein UT28_C0001G0444 [Berkelbacteria bacterium GW2011_GWE1_39_12]HBO60840.1 ribonuclease P protein component [Candidatus Berkelbacteria bacterium]